MQIYGILLNIRGILLKNRENQRISENFGEKWRISGKSFRFLSISFHFITLSFLFIPQPLDFLPQMLNLTIHNKKVIFLFGRT